MLIFQKCCLTLAILDGTQVHPCDFRKVHIWCADSDTVIYLCCDCDTIKTIIYNINGFEIQVYARGIKGIPSLPDLIGLCNCAMSLQFVVAFWNDICEKEMEQNQCQSIHMQGSSQMENLQVPVLILSPCTYVVELTSLLFCPYARPSSVSTEVLFCMGVLVFPTL